MPLRRKKPWKSLIFYSFHLQSFWNFFTFFPLSSIFPVPHKQDPWEPHNQVWSWEQCLHLANRGGRKKPFQKKYPDFQNVLPVFTNKDRISSQQVICHPNEFSVMGDWEELISVILLSPGSLDSLKPAHSAAKLLIIILFVSETWFSLPYPS